MEARIAATCAHNLVQFQEQMLFERERLRQLHIQMATTAAEESGPDKVARQEELQRQIDAPPEIEFKALPPPETKFVPKTKTGGRGGGAAGGAAKKVKAGAFDKGSAAAGAATRVETLKGAGEGD